jgi:hypothetical protein
MKKIQKSKPASRVLSTLWIVALIFYPLLASAQQLTPVVIGTAGETFVNGSAYLDFSIGEIATEPLSNGNGILTQGFLQGISNPDRVNEKLIDDNLLVIYPNPAIEKVFLQNNTNYLVGKFNIKSIQGSNIISGTLSGQLTTIDVVNLKPGLYLIIIQLTSHQQVNKLFVKQ